MTDDAKHQSVEIDDGERSVASAEVTTSAGVDGTARVSLHAESGHLPAGSRARLVDAVLDLPEVQDSTRVEANIPVGDGESLDRLRERTDGMTTRAAGASILADGDVHRPPALDPAEPVTE
jgi:hypothetical protein